MQILFRSQGGFEFREVSPDFVFFFRDRHGNRFDVFAFKELDEDGNKCVSISEKVSGCRMARGKTLEAAKVALKEKLDSLGPNECNDKIKLFVDKFGSAN